MRIQKSLFKGILVVALLTLLPGFAAAEPDSMSTAEDDTSNLQFSTGYRWVDTDHNPGRAAEYSDLDDSATFSLLFQNSPNGVNYSLGGYFLGEDDYFFEGELDYQGLIRLEAATERLFHNLDHIPYEDHPEAREGDPGGEVDYQDLSSPDAQYGRRVTIDSVGFRGKLPTYPAHLTLSYWRLEKEGKEQLRFVDENCAGACHMQSRTSKIDRVTEEITAGIDAHLGPVDIAFLQTLREYDERGDTPVDMFNAHMLGRTAGDYMHDESPDARLTESTFMINLPPSGGFVTSARYTIGKRENKSDLNVLAPVDAETDYQKLAADVSYTPNKTWSFNFRYRMLDLDSDVPSMLTSSEYTFGSFGATVPVRESIDIERDNYQAFVSYRQTNQLNFKGEFEYEHIKRSDTGLGTFNSFAGVDNPYWALPDEEETYRYRLGFYSRWLEKSALKLNGWYEYRSVNDPAYSITLNDSHEVYLSLNYRPSNIWGAAGSLDILRGENDKRTVVQFHNDDMVPYDLDRKEERENLSVGLWFIPNDIISADLNYGLLHSQTDQDVLFGNEPDPLDPGGPNDYTILDDNADYEQLVHTLSAGINARITDRIGCRLEAYHIRSEAEFSPGFDPRFLNVGGWVDAVGVQEISEVDIRQNGVKGRINWKLTEQISTTFEYTYDDYEDMDRNAYDGTAQTFIASLNGTF